jgi:hypothetical protein
MWRAFAPEAANFATSPELTLPDLLPTQAGSDGGANAMYITSGSAVN